MNEQSAILEKVPNNMLFEELARSVSRRALLRREEPLASRTTLRVGGAAEIYSEPADESDLANLLKFCARHAMPFMVLGRGSNLLIKDKGFQGVVICLAQPHFNRIVVNGNQIRCGAGARVRAVAVEARRHALSGFEFLEGIPGTVGGALRMNAGAMNSATFDRLENVRMMDFEGNVFEKPVAEIIASYRNCETLKTHIALEAEFRGTPSETSEIDRRMNEYSRKRWSSQPAAPSAGCIFKNPLTIPAGKLIEELGLKGTRVGGAVVSAEHGNFIVTDGKATAKDVLELIEIIRQRARKARAIELETEVQIVGE